MLKVTDTEEYVVDKVMDVLSKNMQMEQIIIKSDPTILSFPNLDIHLKEQKIYLNDKYISLNRHEFDTLVYLAGHPGWVRSKEQIYEAVWREEVADYENAVMWCISQLRKKLGNKSKGTPYIETVWGMGYKFNHGL